VDAVTGEWMIYGANGYTGELIARTAAQRGLRPVLAGRSFPAITRLADELRLRAHVFDLKDAAAVDHYLAEVDVVLHCAGPFSATSAPMLAGCLRTGTHYLDITGEIAVFEHAYSQHEAAADAGVVVCPGVGFDVIPTDCMAATLLAAMPDATHLALGFDTRGRMSVGTRKTSVESLRTGGQVRRDGTVVRIPIGGLTRQINFGNGTKPAAAIPWGDVASAWRSTDIPNIEVYIPTPPSRSNSLRWVNRLRPILRLGVFQGIAKRGAGKSGGGPTAQERAKTPTYVWGEVRNAAGAVKTGRIKTANGYTLTVDGSLAVVDYVLHNAIAGGAYTPSQLMGPDLVTRLPGSGELVIK
jgi:short subunit dehydrogenase-like uncharacterized protein